MRKVLVLVLVWILGSFLYKIHFFWNLFQLCLGPATCRGRDVFYLMRSCFYYTGTCIKSEICFPHIIYFMEKRKKAVRISLVPKNTVSCLWNIFTWTQYILWGAVVIPLVLALLIHFLQSLSTHTHGVAVQFTGLGIRSYSQLRLIIATQQGCIARSGRGKEQIRQSLGGIPLQPTCVLCICTQKC